MIAQAEPAVTTPFKDVNGFRSRRGKLLSEKIKQVRGILGRDLRILDVGGRGSYWGNVSPEGIAHIEIMNYEAGELAGHLPAGYEGVTTETTVGDARDMRARADGSVDFVHSNSVIEHVGAWPDMVKMAREMMRVGLSGWMQTPAWEFPIEPHFRAPFLHWFGQPLRRKMLSLSSRYRKNDLAQRRGHIDRINLLSRGEVVDLFPGADLYTERVALLPKSYVAYWLPSQPYQMNKAEVN
ncbi:class I SAM-dependent methyltransferase [Loktanella sp. R86503]|uniref:class I SAM-dependent methyltransferase n=1 Tax=Loktanella sp. R86503 TaxID=3093847 RepID=UPI0036D7D7F2